MEIQLPEDLKIAQERINQFYQDERLKQQIGKYYSEHTGTGYPTGLRRIYLDNNNNVTVDEYHISSRGEEKSFGFKSWRITEVIQDAGFRELEGKVFYECLKRFLNIEALKIGKEQWVAD